jgi:lysophospholipase L1-like esterase
MKTPLVRIAACLFPLFAFAQAPAGTAGPAPAAPAPALAPDLKADPAAENRKLNPALPTLFVAGDSTAAKNNGNPIQGWAEPFADYFDPAKINVANRARGGRSSRTFIAEGLWDQLLAEMKARDIVLIQFGHNDASPVNEDASVPREKWRSRGSLPGLGEETTEIDNVITGKHETIHTFGWYMRRMVADVKARGATPIILSLTVRDIWKDGKVERGSGSFRTWDRTIAEQAGVAFVDVTRIVADRYQVLGSEKVHSLYGPDHTHPNVAGAEFHAAAVLAGLKGIRKGPFQDWFSAKGTAVEADALGWLNLPEPADPKLPSIVLIGDSLVRNGRDDGEGGQWGWGDYLADHFDPAKANVVNRAVGGLSSRTYLTQGHWERARTLLKPGDFVVIQLGHNDSSALNDDKRARGTLKGVGEETEEIDNILTRQHEVVHTYGWYLRQFVREARAAGATPIVCSLTPRKTWQDGKIVRSGRDGYGGWARRVAEEEKAAFLDVNDLVAARYEALGAGKVDALFGDQNLHTSLAGAKVNAEIVSAALRALPGDPFKAFAK